MSSQQCIPKECGQETSSCDYCQSIKALTEQMRQLNQAAAQAQKTRNNDDQYIDDDPFLIPGQKSKRNPNQSLFNQFLGGLAIVGGIIIANIVKAKFLSKSS